MKTIADNYPRGPCELPVKCNCGTIVTKDNVIDQECELEDGYECEVCLYCGTTKCPDCGTHTHCGGCI